MDFSPIMDFDYSMWDATNAWTAAAGLSYPSSLPPYPTTPVMPQPSQAPLDLSAYHQPPAPVSPLALPPQAAGVATPPQPTTQFSQLSPSEQAALLKQLGIDASQVAPPALVQQYQQQQLAQHYQQQQQQQLPQYLPQQQPQAVAAAPVSSAVVSTPVQLPQYDQQQSQQNSVQAQAQQYAIVPEAPPHYSNRYTQSKSSKSQNGKFI